MHYRYLPVLIISALALTQLLVDGEIHRAKTSVYKSGKRAGLNAQLVDVAQGGEMPTSGDAGDPATVHMVVDEENFQTYDVWIYSIAGAILVGLSGILPLIIMPIEAGPSLKHGGKSLVLASCSAVEKHTCLFTGVLRAAVHVCTRK